MYLLLVFVSIVAGIIIFAAYDRPYYLASGTCSTAMIIIAGIWVGKSKSKKKKGIKFKLSF